MIEKTINKLFVQLGSTFDKSRFENMSRNDKIEEFLKPEGTVFVEVISLKQAAELCREFISRFNLSSSNWMGGLIVDDNFNFIARVSYNGRVWNNTEDNWKIAKEIAI